MKGPRDDCDEHRGIVLECHAGKGLKELLAPRVMGPYARNMPDTQHGATPGRGADMASHVIHSALDYAAAAKMSVCILIIYPVPYTHLTLPTNRVV